MRKRFIALTIVCSLGSFALGAYADTPIKKVEAYLRPDYKVVVNGHPENLAKPVILYEDRSYLPVGLLAPLLNVDINWDEKTKTIYLLPRVGGQPTGTGEQDETYPIIKMEYVQPYQVSYMGGTYPVLSVQAKGDTYYRVKDLARMGVDPNALSKAKEKFTGDLYVTKKEMNTFLKDPNAVWTATYEPIITGETDEAKIAALKKFPQELQQANAAMTNNAAAPYDVFYSIDATDEPNTYLMLVFETDQYYQFKVKLYKQVTNVNGEDQVTWFLSGYNKIDIQAGDKPTDPSYWY